MISREPTELVRVAGVIERRHEKLRALPAALPAALSIVRPAGQDEAVFGEDLLLEQEVRLPPEGRKPRARALFAT